jgi:hypothetical protein
LYIRGRDIEEVDKSVRFDAGNAQWSVLGDYENAVPVLQGLQRKIFDHLSVWDIAPLTPAAIADAIGESRPQVKTAIWRMAQADPPLVRKSNIGVGTYEVTPSEGR